MQLFDSDLVERRERLLTLLSGEGEPFCRAMPEHITVSAIVHRSDTDALLMIHHSKLQRLLLPGGHVEPESDLSLLAAAQRECLEETGIDPIATSTEAPLLIDIDIHTIPANARERAHSHLDARYLFRVKACGDLLPGAAWVARADVIAQFPEAIARPARRARSVEDR